MQNASKCAKWRNGLFTNLKGSGEEQPKRQFIGGAERARRNARKRQRQHLHGGDTNNKRGGGTGAGRIPKSIKPMDRFFASLFQSSVDDYVKSSQDDSVGTQCLLGDICNRAGLPLPAQLSSSNKDAHEFYSTRASLVLEEARCVVAEALKPNRHVRPPHNPRNSNSDNSLTLRLVSIEQKEKLKAMVMTFEKPPKSSGTSCFTPQELYDMRPGGCFEVMVEGKLEVEDKQTTHHQSIKSVLASVVPLADRSKVERQLSLMVYQQNLNFRGEDDAKDEQQPFLWYIRPLTTLISECRQFEACTQKTNVAFMPKLLAWKDATHIRFDSDEEEDEEELNTNVNDGTNDDGGELYDMPKEVKVLQLNPTQERAAATYLAAPPSTLTLIQGPPGSGKTTFTVSCILQCLFERPSDDYLPLDGSATGRRILVTAPTNKAITVLASRFLDALNGDASKNVVLIGVEDKLIMEDQPYQIVRHNIKDDKMVLPSTLRDIFVYGWVGTVNDSFRSIRDGLRTSQHGKNVSIISLLAKARLLKAKLANGMPRLFKQSGAAASLDALMHQFDEHVSGVPLMLLEVIHHLDDIIQCLDDIDPSEATQELLATADVIFSTLSTCGVSAMKATKRVTDLFVDEAAAATEPEICIPLHLRPVRMLAVGDPMQLPATIMSQRAAKFGLSKSLHERLMYDCKKEHIMLDTQYRMKPDISVFPSTMFYKGELMNGGNVVKPTYGNSATALFGNKPFIFLQCSGRECQSMSGSYCNKQEAEAVVKLVKKVAAAENQTRNSSSRTVPWHSPDKIRIITFYQAQVSLIQRMLHQIGLGRALVATVDSCQGCESDVVVVSFVRSNDRRGSAMHALGFLTDDRRLNVALTRPKHQLLCVGDATTLSSVQGTTMANFVAHARATGCIMKP